MEVLTPKRKSVLDFVTHYIDEHSYAPSVSDIVKGCNLSSPSIAQHHLNVLERQGYIRRTRDIPRSISLSNRQQRVATVPLMGIIAAGQPIPVPTEDTWRSVPLEMIDVPKDFVRGKEHVYALKVKGTSMIDALIDDGDMVLVEQASCAENGEMVALWLKNEQEATLKRLYFEPGKLRLQPANRQMQPTYHKPENVEVQGKVIGVIRKVLATE